MATHPFRHQLIDHLAVGVLDAFLIDHKPPIGFHLGVANAFHKAFKWFLGRAGHGHPFAVSGTVIVAGNNIAELIAFGLRDFAGELAA